MARLFKKREPHHFGYGGTLLFSNVNYSRVAKNLLAQRGEVKVKQKNIAGLRCWMIVVVSSIITFWINPNIQQAPFFGKNLHDTGPGIRHAYERKDGPTSLPKGGGQYRKTNIS